MFEYIFILGRNSELSAAEIKAVFDDSQVEVFDSTFLVLSLAKEIDCQAVLSKLGGTIKIGQIIGDCFDKEMIISELKKVKQTGKINFGLSFYNFAPSLKIGLEIKKELKQAGLSSRLVVSKEKTLSSVVVAKNKCHEFIVAEADGKIYLAKTCAVQDFEDYSRRDFGRPSRDLVSGSLPPKLAQIMINLAQINPDKKLLDPFCGSGTILQEALLMGYQDIIGSDISSKAIEDSRHNLEWLGKNLTSRQACLRRQARGDNSQDYKLLNVPVQNISEKVKDADAIVTEPFLGPPLKGSEGLNEIKKIIQDLEKLYLEAFEQFKKVLNQGGKVVIVFPYFKKFDLTLQILPNIKKMGFNPINSQQLFYSRPDQKVWRQILVFVKEEGAKLG
ncbi:MAG: hypothetical protein JW816_03085 [Candidatus Buchananbacteria bacterium]|nr:hypothetical protein [Candidatus Buchananbacteria bacterium]